MNKVYGTTAEAIADVDDGAVIMFGGFFSNGSPTNLILALAERGTKNITAMSNNIGLVDRLDILCKNRQLRKFIGAFPFRASNVERPLIQEAFMAGEVEVEIVPMGTFIERIRAGGAGIGGFYTPTGIGTVVAEGKEERTINGKRYLLEMPLTADFAFIKAYKADTMGNLIYRGSARNFNAMMATAARVTIADVEEIVEVGELDPEIIVTPGIFVDRIVKGPRYDPDGLD
ncbi:MAG: CoA transferase subunit A [Dehalococcoidia bacterium]|jgi:3-oxoacid CoA-transferase subunit A